jgi:hypothetical protein
MRYLAALIYGLFFCGLAFGEQKETIGAPVINTSSGMQAVFVQARAGKYHYISLLYTNYVYKGFTNLLPENVITNLNYYTLVQTNNTNTIRIYLIQGQGNCPFTNNGVRYYPGAAIEGLFDPSTSYQLKVHYKDASSVDCSVPGPAITNAWYSYIGGYTAFTVMPINAGGNNGLGLQYNFAYQITSYDTFQNYSLGDGKYTPFNTSNEVAYIKFDVLSQGEFGFNSGSSNSNNVQDSLTASMDFEGLLLGHMKSPVSTDSIVYPAGILLSPVGFEWNKEFSLGNYTPKIALGGALPVMDWPALCWSKWAGLTNGFTPPTIFSGITYVDTLATNHTSLAEAGKVHERWDTELIYDMPLLQLRNIPVSLRFTWNSYVGVDHSMWEHFYQAGVVAHLFNAGGTSQNLFFGYADGAQPPSYTKIGSWRIGYAIQY